MHVHFVCTANTYRSRLAEAYFNSKKISYISASSSGIRAKENICGPICWEAQRIVEVEGLVPYMSPMWQQTTNEVLAKADVVVFMEQQQYEFAKETCDFIGDRYQIWEIPDLDELMTSEIGETIEKVQASEKTFLLIKKKVDELIATVT